MAEKEMETPMDSVVGVEEEFVDKMPRRYQRRRPRQVCRLYRLEDVDYLRQFIPERGKIMPRRISGITAKDQRRLATAIKRASDGTLAVRFG
jgi:small subunit ribosomal protein S18